MPFPHQVPMRFTREDIMRLLPNQIGCYGLFSGQQWIYVGKGNIRDRLLDHLRGDNALINSMRPTHFVAVQTVECDQVEKDLIRECRPLCNQKVG
jgi:hypothetical protein